MPEYDIALELAKLHILKGGDFVRQLRFLAHLNIFKPVENEKNIFAADASHHEDFNSLPHKLGTILKRTQKLLKYWYIKGRRLSL